VLKLLLVLVRRLRVRLHRIVPSIRVLPGILPEARILPETWILLILSRARLIPRLAVLLVLRGPLQRRLVRRHEQPSAIGARVVYELPLVVAVLLIELANRLVLAYARHTHDTAASKDLRSAIWPGFL